MVCLDDARRRPDERLRLAMLRSPRHREARVTRPSSVREHRQERDAGSIEAGEGRRDLGHLHQRQRLHHPAPPEHETDDDGRSRRQPRSSPGDLLAHDHAHAAPMKPYSMAAIFTGTPSSVPAADDDRVEDAGGGLAGRSRSR